MWEGAGNLTKKCGICTLHRHAQPDAHKTITDIPCFSSSITKISASEHGCSVFWPAAKDLACVVHKIMRKKRNAANDSEIYQESSAIRGLPVYHIVGFSRPEEFLLYHPPSSVRSSIPSLELELEMQMLSRVLKPPNVLAAAGAVSSRPPRRHCLLFLCSFGTYGKSPSVKYIFQYDLISDPDPELFSYLSDLKQKSNYGFLHTDQTDQFFLYIFIYLLEKYKAIGGCQLLDLLVYYG